MDPAEPLPPGVASNAVACQPQPVPKHHVVRAETGHFSVMGSPLVLLLTPASHHLIAHARTLAADRQHQFAVVFAHAACELHTEGELIRLLAPRQDRLLADLVLPDDRDTKTLANGKVCRVYTALTGDNPSTAEWWAAWQTSRKDRQKVEAALKPPQSSTGAASTASPGATKNPNQ
jgi:hypothetical protein